MFKNIIKGKLDIELSVILEQKSVIWFFSGVALDLYLVYASTL